MTKVILISWHILQLIGWVKLEGASYEWTWVDELDAEVQIPTFGQELKALEGSQLELSGYFLPLEIDGKTIIISKKPYASCFFCGGDAGPESVVEVQFKEPHPTFQPDQILQVQGTLSLNKDDYEHLIYILTDAILIDEL
ncbi:MAG: DUF3299 domain-containing protein [Bacteroidota bacterium]